MNAYGRCKATDGFGLLALRGILFEAVKECLCDLLLEIDPWKLGDHFRAKLGRKGFVPDTE
jgi:hypothetical protein